MTDTSPSEKHTTADFCNNIVQNKTSILPEDYYVLIIYLLFITLDIYILRNVYVLYYIFINTPNDTNLCIIMVFCIQITYLIVTDKSVSI